MKLIVNAITAVYNLLWGDLFTIPLPGGGSLGISLLVLLLIPTGIFFTIRTRFLPVRLFPEMLRVTAEKRTNREGDAISGGADAGHPGSHHGGLLQALGVFIDTIVICSCTAFIILVTPAEKVAGLEGMDLLQASMRHHLGQFGVVFIALILWLFSFSTFVGILFYARSNVAYLFGDSWLSQTLYKVLALAMLFVGGLAAYTFVWDLGDVGVGLMTVFNIVVIIPMSGQALGSLRDYESNMKKRQKE